VNFVMLPSKTLGDPDASPFRLCEQPKDTRVIRVEIFLWHHLQELLGQNYVTVFIFVI